MNKGRKTTKEERAEIVAFCIKNGKDYALINRKFNDREYLEVVISDLTYVRVGDRWCYVCILIDLFNREIIGYSSGTKKNAELVAE